MANLKWPKRIFDIGPRFAVKYACRTIVSDACGGRASRPPLGTPNVEFARALRGFSLPFAARGQGAVGTQRTRTSRMNENATPFRAFVQARRPSPKDTRPTCASIIPSNPTVAIQSSQPTFCNEPRFKTHRLLKRPLPCAWQWFIIPRETNPPRARIVRRSFDASGVGRVRRLIFPRSGQGILPWAAAHAARSRSNRRKPRSGFWELCFSILRHRSIRFLRVAV